MPECSFTGGELAQELRSGSVRWLRVNFPYTYGKLLLNELRPLAPAFDEFAVASFNAAELWFEKLSVKAKEAEQSHTMPDEAASTARGRQNHQSVLSTAAPALDIHRIIRKLERLVEVYGLAYRPVQSPPAI